MPGSALNGINGYALDHDDLVRIITFLRGLEPTDRSFKASAQPVYEVASGFVPGQPLSAQAIKIIRDTIDRYADSRL